jgi:hypothetical protein
LRYSSEYAKCSCGNDIYIGNTALTKCDKCDKDIIVRYISIPQKYYIPVSNGSVIYKYQLDPFYDTQPLGLVTFRQDKANSLELKNVTNSQWTAYTLSGKAKEIAPGDAVPFIKGISIKYGGRIIELI